MLNNTKKFASTLVAGLTVAATLAFAPAANAATPAEVVLSPSISVADDGSFNYVPGEWTGDYTTLTVGWYSCPTAQLGAIGATADLLQQLTDAGCTFVSSGKSQPAETFDNISTFPVVIETADDTTSAFQGNNIIMYDKTLGPIAYNMRGFSGKAKASRTIGFAGKSATLNKSARAGLYSLLSKIGNGQKVVITVDAYAAKGGSSKHDQALAMGRARQVKSFFKKNGVAATFKLRSHTASVAGAAGRKASVKVSFVPAGQ